MKRDLDRASKERFDVIIIGGGIIGAGIARDAALRGLRVLLVEKDDFAAGTTSRSTRLIHGGLRYLRTFQFGLVRQDLREREILLKIAPHLVQRLKFIIPLLRSQPYYRLTLPFGLYLYDLLVWNRDVPRRQHLSVNKTLKLEPALAEIQDLIGSYVYQDCQAVRMERLCMENLVAAAESGACVINHAAANSLALHGAKVSSLDFHDQLSGETRRAEGTIVINAAGHWADYVWQKLKVQGTVGLRRTKGIHLLTRKIAENAVVLFARSDGRLFFVIPWGENSLIGTTDTDYRGDPDNVQAEAKDIEYLVNETRHYFPQFSQGDVFYAMAGLRPLVEAKRKAASDTSRAHRIIDHSRAGGPDGLITVLGGKITAYRGIAEETVDLVCRKLGRRENSTTATRLLPGAEPGRIDPYSAAIDITQQVKYAVEEEEALTVEDFLLRRSSAGLAPSQGLDILERVAAEMGKLLGWSDRDTVAQIESYRKLALIRSEAPK